MECDFCGKVFKTKTGFARHSCKRKEAADRVGHDRLIAAYELFNFWFKYNGVRKKNYGKDLSGFKKSPYFSIFTELTLAIQNVFIADPKDYIMWLSDKQIPSRRWSHDDVLTQYKKIQSQRGSGVDRAIRCLELMTMFCDQKDHHLSEFFEIINLPEAIRWIESGRLSPWVFLLVKDASHIFNRMKERDYERVAKAIDIKYWENRFKVSPDDKKEVETILHEFGFTLNE